MYVDLSIELGSKIPSGFYTKPHFIVGAFVGLSRSTWIESAMEYNFIFKKRKNMKKIILVLLMCGFSQIMANGANTSYSKLNEPNPSNKNKEKSGVFIGFELGSGEMAQRQIGGGGGSRATRDIFGISKYTQSMSVYGGSVGYKYFINSWFGIRGYINISYSYLSQKVSNFSFKILISNIVYTESIDLLFNFYNGESASFGAFLGMGLGGSTWIESTTESYSGFYMDAKLGFRANFAKSHSIEFGAKIPFLDAKTTINTSNGNLEVKSKQNFQILVGYNFTF